MARTKKPPLSFEEKYQRQQDKYGYYDPSKTGYGTPDVLKDIFDQVMGNEAALNVLGADNPLTILGFKSLPTATGLKERFRQLMLENHPDKGGSHEKAQKIIAAYSTLKLRCA